MLVVFILSIVMDAPLSTADDMLNLPVRSYSILARLPFPVICNLTVCWEFDKDNGILGKVAFLLILTACTNIFSLMIVYGVLSVTILAIESDESLFSHLLLVELYINILPSVGDIILVSDKPFSAFAGVNENTDSVISIWGHHIL